MGLFTRANNGGPITIEQMDYNLLYLEQLLLNSGLTGSGSIGVTGPTGPTGLAGTNGTAGIVEVTKLELDNLVNTNSLVPSQVYKITGVCKNKNTGNYPMVDTLYDDGTNSGVTIYLTAISNNTLSENGYGEFYNPNYYDNLTYNLSNGTGLYGIWDGDNPYATASYALGQVVYWGGYAWENLTGNKGTKNNILNLDSTNWVKLPYTDSHYTKVIDYIEYSYKLDYMLRRVNAKNKIDVYMSPDTFQYNEGADFHSIAVMAWGLYSKISESGGDNWYDDNISGISNVTISNSYCETVNFKGTEFEGVELTNYSVIKNNYYGEYTSIVQVKLEDWSEVSNNTFFDAYLNNTRLITSYIRNNIVRYGRFQNGNVLKNSGMIDNTFFGGYIEGNVLNGGYINNNNLTDNARISYNNLLSGNINDNILNNSIIRSNNLNYSFIINNTVTTTNIENNELNCGAYISYITNSSGITHGISYNNISSSTIGNTSLGGNIANNSLFNSSFLSFTGMVNSVRNCVLNSATTQVSLIGINISSASVIYQFYTKTIIRGSNNQYYLTYYNGSSQVYVAINA